MAVLSRKTKRTEQSRGREGGQRAVVVSAWATAEEVVEQRKRG
jgi:hypothetical protein